MRSPRFLLTGLAGLLVGASFAGLVGCRKAESVAAVPLRVAIDLWPGYYPLVIAQEKGYLAAEGVAVDLSIPQDTHRMIAEFAANELDLICVSMGDIVLTTRVRPDIRMILCSDESAGGDQLLAVAAEGEGRSYRGSRIGTTLGGFGELFVRRFLAREDLRRDEVVMIDADAADVVGMLERGELDIGHTWEPYAGQARAKGFVPVFTSLDTPGAILDGLITHDTVLRRREAEVRGLVRAWFQAVDWWRANEAEGCALVEAKLGLEPGSVSLEGIHLLDREENLQVFDLTALQGLRRATEDYVEFFVSRGLLGHRVLPQELLSPQFLE